MLRRKWITELYLDADPADVVHSRRFWFRRNAKRYANDFQLTLNAVYFPPWLYSTRVRRL